MLTVKLDAESERRLEWLATHSGHTKASFVREAIAAHLDDLEDLHHSGSRLRNFRNEEAIGIAELKGDLGLAD